MEELATAAPPRHRGRRHRRKASDAGARAAYGDVFGGPPRFAAPFAGVPGDYAEVFGGVAASCSIPYLDLPPSAARDDGAGGYGEIFGPFDFGDFAAPYEDLLAGAEGMAEEVASSSGSSRSSIRIESGQLDAEPSMHYKHYPDVGCDQHFDEEQFSTISFSPDGEQQFSMSYNKTTRGRPDDLVELATCVVKPSISYVVDSCNLSNDSATNHVPLMDNGLLANGQKGELSPPFPACSSVKSANSVSIADQKQHTPTCVPISEIFYEDENYHKRSSTHSASSEEAPSPDYPFLRVSNINLQTPPIKGKPGDLVELATCVVEPSISYVVDSCNLSNDSATNHVPLMDNGLLANGQKGELSPPFPASSSVKSANSVSVADQKQHMPTCVPISENFYEDDNYYKRSSTHSASSEEAPSPDYPFLRVSNINLQTPPIKVQPPSMPPSNLLKKRESKPNGDSEVNPNSAAAAAAIKEAMEFAEARLKAAKELMERKGDSFKLRKRPGHHRGTKSTEIKSTEIKENKTPEEVHVFEENLTLRRLAKEEKNYEDLSLLDKNRDGSLVKLPHCDRNEKEVLPPGKPQQIMQSGSKLEQLGRWASGAEFYELISHDQKCKTDTAACEGDNGWTANPFTKPGKFEKGKGGVTAGDLERYGKLCDGNDITELRMKHANLREDDTASMEVEHKAPTASEVPLHEERAVYEETSVNHFKECLEVRNSPEGHDDDGRFEISCINGIPPKLHVPEISSLSLETCISGGHANDNKNCSDASTEETPLVGKSNKDNNNKEGLKIPCADETLCTSVRSQILQEHPEVPNIDEIEASQAKVEKLEESAESYVTQCFLTMSSTVHGEAETNEKDKLFSFVDESCVQNENEIITEAHSEALIHEEMRKFETEEKTGQHEEFQDVDVEFQDVDVEFQDVDVDWDAGSPENEANVTLKSSNANETEEAEVLNVFVGDSKLMESNVRTCGTFDSDQLQESQLKSEDLENRMDGVEDLVSDGNEKEAKEPLVENNEKTLVEEILNYDSKDGQTSMETGISKGPNDVYAEVNVRNNRGGAVLHSGTEVIANDDSDYTMKMNTCSKDPQASFSEACTILQHLSQNAESVSSQMSEKSTPVLGNLEEDCRKAERDFPTEKYAALEEGENTRSKMEERDGKDRISSVELKNQQSVHLDSDANIMPKFAVDTASNFVQKSTEETPDFQRIEGRDNVKKTEREIEKEKEVFRKLDEEKERECKMEKEKEQTKERPRRELEEEKERERERAKDRLAVQRATREAHERAFAEARAKAERIALERITSARQRASAEAREKEEKASAEAAAENASREARIKAERAAVERATAEARERAIEKAKAAADAKERMERFKSSFKDSFKDINQDNQQDTQFQTTASNNHGRSTDSCNQVAEVESALRHKARSERHRRTAERAAKALAEKNMRDMLAQREQAEKHRLAEFLDPEVKRWSNGKEGNLRALLSTLQYILGSDSGWQSVPLTDLITAAAVKKAYRRATLCVHPDKLQQRGATIRQKYICEKVFDLLKEAWNKFNSEER